MSRERRGIEGKSNVEFRVRYSKDEDGWLVGECLDIPGAISQGKSLYEVSRNLQDAMRAIIEVALSDREETARVVRAARQVLATRMNAEVLFSTAAAREQAPKSVAAHAELIEALAALDEKQS